MQCNFKPLVGFEMTYLDFLGAHDHLWNLAGGMFRFGVILMSQRSHLPKNHLAFCGLAICKCCSMCSACSFISRMVLFKTCITSGMWFPVIPKFSIGSMF